MTSHLSENRPSKFFATLGLALLLNAPSALASPGHSETINAKAVETSFAAALTSVESNKRGTVGLGVTRFEKLREILWTSEIGMSYHHQNSLDQLDVEVAFGFAKPLASGFHPYVSFAVGRRFSWVGSFSQSQLTLGPSFGFRQLIGSRAGIRTEYRYRRVKSSATANYSEQSLQIGVSLFWNNKP